LFNRSQVISELPRSEAQEDERRELGAVAAALENSSRLLQLVTYIGDKYFKGETDKLHEYEIATEVFGRSKSTFDAGEDAIVRVEAHRLRKRLKEYYQNGGKDHPVQLTIPPGSYVPVFTRRSIPLETPEPEADPSQGRRTFLRSYVVAATALILTIAVLYFVLRERRAVGAASTIAASTAIPPPAAALAQTPVRILAGYTGKPQIDSAGAVWQPDEFFQYGGTWSRPDVVVSRTSNPMLYQHWRNGNFSYDIPLSPGVYELHLYLLSQDPNPSSASSFSVSTNGKPLLTGFDIDSDALGPNVADERVFRDISPKANGLLRLDFASESVPAMLNAIEILPGLAHRQLPIRIVMQPTSFTDHDGNFWHPDNYYMGGYTLKRPEVVAGTSDPSMFAAERYGHFSYAIPVDTRDRYTLVLHFAESYFGPNASGVGGVGSRVFRVLCNGNTLLDDFDIYKEVGNLHAVTKTFYHLKPTAQGKLNITFEPIVNNATVSAIEVIDESR